MTTTRRRTAALLTAALLTATLTTAGSAAGALEPDVPVPPGDGVRVTVEIDERGAPEVEVVLGSRPLVPGGPLVVRGTGHEAASRHEIALLGRAAALATATAGPDGAFEVTTRLPLDTAPGVHRVRVHALATGAEVLSAPFTVVAADVPTTPPGDGVPGGDGAGGGVPGDGVPGDGPTGDTDDAGSGDGTAGGGTAGGGTTGGGTAAAPPGGLATTGVGLAAAAAVAGLAVAAGVALRGARRTARAARRAPSR